MTGSGFALALMHPPLAPKTGERNSGKSTIASYLSSTTSPSADQNNTTTTTAAATTTATTTTTTTTNTKTAIQPATDKDDDDVDLGTSYTTVEIGDDGDDGQWRSIPLGGLF
jgi:hypothetical protein